jgi:hypothetical protein
VSYYSKCRKAINRFLKNDRLGSIGHISCVDRGSRAAELSDGLAALSARRLTSICALLDASPTSVIARSSNNDRVSSLQAFLHFGEQGGVHYFATTDDGPAETELWIEGTEGSLRTDGNSVWWRKRGWPVFIPTRIGLFGVRASSKSGPAEADLASAIEKSVNGGGIVDLTNAG